MKIQLYRSSRMRAIGCWLLVALPLCWASCPTDTICEAEFDRCYKFVNEEIDFFSAEDICVGFGGHLVSIKNAFEAARVKETAKSMFVGLSDYWIGANHILTDYWSWTDGSCWKYTNWFPGGDSEDGAVYASLGSGLWTAASEGLYKPFVCAFPYVSQNATQCPVCEHCPTLAAPTQCPVCPKTTAAPKVTCPACPKTTVAPKVTCPACPKTTAAPKVTCPTTAAPKPCPRRALCEDGWSHFGETNSCYKIIHNRNFASAEQLCVQYGGHLASIHSEAESNFVSGFASTGLSLNGWGMTWIGLHKVSNVWRWTDETPVNYINWSVDSPSNTNGNEACVNIYSDYLDKTWPEPYHWKWNDAPCDATIRAAVCKKAEL